MLPAKHRLRSPAQFTAVLRGRSRRQGSRLIVVHIHFPSDRDGQPSRVGFVVSKAVGGAVVRNRTKRRLRHECAARLGRLGTGIDIVVRANPAAAAATSADLGAALDRVWERIAADGCRS